MTTGSPRVIVVAGPGEVAATARDLVLESEARALEARGRFTIALAGGATPRLLYEELAASLSARFDAWNVFFGDERWVPAGHPDSNFRMASEALLSRVPIPARQVHRIAAAASSPAKVAELHDYEIRRVLAPPPGTPARFDLVLLGLGADGHTASLFPGSTALVAEAGRLCVATWAPGPRAGRVTRPAAAITAARRVVFVVSGRDKADAVAKALSPDLPPPVPAGLIRPVPGELVYVLDEGAASSIR
jgi:6-phosphogluconolactonase